MATSWTSLLRGRGLATLGLTTLGLLGCGGGGGEASSPAPLSIDAAPEVRQGEFQLNPGATWRGKSPGDYYSGKLMSVDLTRLNAGQPVESGRVLDVQSLGSFKYDAQAHLAFIAAGMFVDAQGLPVAPGPGSSVLAVSTSQECGLGSGEDSVPEDFTFSTSTLQALVVPATAVALRLSVSDCYFRDNAISDDPIRVRIILRPATTGSAA